MRKKFRSNFFFLQQSAPDPNTLVKDFNTFNHTQHINNFLAIFNTVKTNNNDLSPYDPYFEEFIKAFSLKPHACESKEFHNRQMLEKLVNDGTRLLKVEISMALLALLSRNNGN